MSKKHFPASLLTAVLVATGIAVPVQAGHGMSQGAHGQMSEFMTHHGFTQPEAQQESPAKLGVAISAVTQANLDSLDLEYGVRIQKVLEGSIAERAGLKSGDVVTEIDTRPAYSPERLRYLVGQASGPATLSVLRAGKSLQLETVFAEPQTGRALLGVRIQEMTDELKEAFGTSGDAGVLISQVLSGSAAKQAGLKAGDVIVSIGARDVTSVHDVHGVLADYAPGDGLDVAFVRERETRVMRVVLDGAPSDSQSQAMDRRGMPGHGGYGHGYHGSMGMMPRQGCDMTKGQRRS